MKNNSPCTIDGIEKIRIKIFDETVRTLIDVRNVPNLKIKFISLSTHNSKEYMYTCAGRVLNVS